MAGVSRLQYRTEVRLIRVMCSGRVDLEFVLRAFSKGMDGVFIGGCRLNECNYITHGNYHALNTVLLCRRILEYAGLNPDRLRVEFMSSGDGNLFAEVLNEFSGKVESLGPLGQGEGEPEEGEWRAKLEEARRLIPYIKMAEREKLDRHLERKEEYEGYFTAEEIDRLLEEVPSYWIDPEKCQACMICQRRCPVEAIDGGKNRIHVIDQGKCIKCGTCLEACPPRFGAVQKLADQPVPDPVPEEKRTLARKKKKA
jgi:coenzyme F420-reducing hydrogenase delta subunit/Fe-S-cluster-containing hydrogenase component 2